MELLKIRERAKLMWLISWSRWSLDCSLREYVDLSVSMTTCEGKNTLQWSKTFERRNEKNLITKAKTLEPCKCFSNLIIGVGVHCPNLQEVERLFHLRWKWASCYISHSKSDYHSALRWSRQVVRNCVPWLVSWGPWGTAAMLPKPERQKRGWKHN